MYRIGNKFQYGKSIFVLAMVSKSQVNLIDVETGTRWNEPITLSGTSLTEKELISLIGDDYASKFVGVDNDFNHGVTFDNMEEGKVYELNVDKPAMMFVKFKDEMFSLKLVKSHCYFPHTRYRLVE